MRSRVPFGSRDSDVLVSQVNLESTVDDADFEGADRGRFRSFIEGRDKGWRDWN